MIDFKNCIKGEFSFLSQLFLAFICEAENFVAFTKNFAEVQYSRLIPAFKM